MGVDYGKSSMGVLTDIAEKNAVQFAVAGSKQKEEGRSVCCMTCVTPQPQTKCISGQVCIDNLTCGHTEIQAADPACYLTLSQCTDTRPTSHCTDCITPGIWLAGSTASVA